MCSKDKTIWTLFGVMEDDFNWYDFPHYHKVNRYAIWIQEVIDADRARRQPCFKTFDG